MYICNWLTLNKLIIIIIIIIITITITIIIVATNKEDYFKLIFD